MIASSNISGLNEKYAVIDLQLVYSCLYRLLRAKAQRKTFAAPSAVREIFHNHSPAFFMRVGLPIDIPKFAKIEINRDRKPNSTSIFLAPHRLVI